MFGRVNVQGRLARTAAASVIGGEVMTWHDLIGQLKEVLLQSARHGAIL